MIAIVDDITATWSINALPADYVVVIRREPSITTNALIRRPWYGADRRRAERDKSIVEAQARLHRALCRVLDAERQLRHAEAPVWSPRASDMPWLVHRERWGRTEAHPRIRRAPEVS